MNSNSIISMGGEIVEVLRLPHANVLRVEISVNGGVVILEVPPNLVPIAEGKKVEVEILRERPPLEDGVLALKGVVYSTSDDQISASAHGLLIHLRGTARPNVGVGESIYLRLIPQEK